MSVDSVPNLIVRSNMDTSGTKGQSKLECLPLYSLFKDKCLSIMFPTYI